MRTSPARPLALLLVLTFAPTACSDDSGTGPAGTFGSGTVQVSGAVNVEFSGPAVSVTDALTGLSTFGVSISDDVAGHTFTVVFTAGRPAPGTYTIGSPDTAVYGELGITSDLFESIAGRVTITASSPEALSGTASFTALRLGGLESVAVSARFDARCFAVPGQFSCV